MIIIIITIGPVWLLSSGLILAMRQNVSVLVGIVLPPKNYSELDW